MLSFITPSHVILLFSLLTISFIVTIVWTPLWTGLLYRYRVGKRLRLASDAPVFTKLHEHKAGTPTMGGVLVWVTTLVIALVFWGIHYVWPHSLLARMNFLSRSETWLPLGVLVSSALVGLVDDCMNVVGIGPKGGGLRMRHKLILYTLIALVGVYWFYVKLQWNVLHVPFYGNVQLGLWYVPFFVFVIVATAFSVNEIDGLDGLSGGTLAAALGAYGTIAFVQGHVDLAAMCAVMIGSLLAFLWFNIPPARFFMGDTGAMSLGITLGLIAMLTNQVLLLPWIGILFVIESLSVIIQVASKKIRKKKVFLSAPIHHHLEAIGWSESKIVMRFWLIAAVTASSGIVLALLDMVTTRS